jgi:PAS domain S-box-containing protein
MIWKKCILPGMKAAISRIPRNTKLLASGMSVLSLAMILFAYMEMRSSRDDLLNSVQIEAGILAEVLRQGSESNLLAMKEVEDQIVARLDAACALAARNAKSGTRIDVDFAGMTRICSIDAIMMIGRDGRVLGRSRGDRSGALLDSAIREELLSLGSESDSTLLLFNVPLPGMEGTYVVTAHRLDGVRFIIAGLSDKQFLEIRRRTGIGRMIQNIGSSPDISFVALQDDEGIIAASKGVESLRPVASDTFLVAGLASPGPRSRIVSQNGSEIMEVVQRFGGDGDAPALLRIGLSLANVKRVQQSAMNRFLMLAAISIVAGGLLIGFLLTREKFSALREEHRRVRSTTDLVLDGIADAVVAVDAKGIVSVFNPAAEALFSLAADKCKEKMYELVCPHDELLIRRTLESNAPVEYAECMISDSRNAAHLAGVSTSIIHTPGGSIETVIAVVRDITEQRRAQEKLERKDKLSAMGELAAGVAHEIRNPLNAVNIIAHRLEQEFTPVEGADEYRDLTRTVYLEVRRMNGIITQFLQFARPPKLDPHPTLLCDVISETRALVESQAREHSVEISTDCPGGLQVNIDRDRFKQALLNLFLNAIEAMPEGGKLECSARLESGQISVVVQDTGRGVPADIRKKMFNMYFTTKPGGTGMGLALVHQIISEHDGSIDVRNREEGGTAFTITLVAI